MKVYVVTDGDYSDYHIVSVFSTGEKAKEFIEKMCKEGIIEEYDIDAYIEPLEKGYFPYFVRMTKEGEVLECRKYDCSYPDLDELDFDINKNMYTKCWAKDDGHAIKIAGERRRVILAEERWGKRTGVGQ
jgi:hypothetical protein